MDFKRSLKTIALVALCAASAGVPAQAQGVFNMGALTNTLAQGAIVKSEHERAAGIRGGGRSSSKSNGGQSSPRVTRTLGTFQQSAATRKRNIANFIAKMRVADPQSAAGVQKTLATQDVFGIIGRKMATYGLKTNNIADPMAVYLVVAWQGVRGRDEDPTKAQLLGVRDQMARAMATTPAIKRLTNAQKQQLADSFIVQIMLVATSVNAAQKQPNLMPQVKLAIATGARASFGFDLAAMRLTSNGLQL